MKKRIFCLIILILILCGCTPTKEDLSGSSGLEYTIYDGYCGVSIGECTDTNLIIPRYYQSYKVTRIEDNGFQDCGFITSIYFSDVIDEIGSAAFYNCTGLSSIEVNSKNKTYYSENNALIKKKDNSLILGCSNTIISDNVTSISANAFYGCVLLTSIYIPENVIKIDSKAFNNCTSLEEISVSENNTIYESISNCLIEKKSNTIILGLRTSVIPDTVTSIGIYAFINLDNVEEIIIPGNVQMILDYAFEGCESIKYITLNKGLMYIGSHAFDNCDNIETISTPSTLETISNYAFANCDSLKEVDLNEGLKTLSEGSFYNCESLNKVTIPSSVNSIGKICFSDCANLEKIEIDENNIRYKEINGCIVSNEYLVYMYRNAEIPTTITDINGYAFSGSNVTKVTIPSNVTNIVSNAFVSASNLVDITFEEGIKKIGDYAFSSCAKLESIVLPNSIEIIGSEAFKNCKNLKNITISNKLTSISTGMFQNCYKLENVYNTENIINIYTNAFYNCTSLKEIDLSKVEQIENYSFYNCFSLKKVELIYTINIGISAFENCKGLDELLLSDSLELINTNAFHSCIILEELIIPETVKTIKEGAFSNCPLLKVYCFAKSRPSGWNKKWIDEDNIITWKYSLDEEEDLPLEME